MGDLVSNLQAIEDMEARQAAEPAETSVSSAVVARRFVSVPVIP